MTRSEERSAAGALAAGRPLDALSALERKDDARARALRGVALAQLGEYDAAFELLERAARELRDPRALAAAGEVAAARRDFPLADSLLRRAIPALRRAGDRRNASWALVARARAAALAGDARLARACLARARNAPADATVRAGLALARAEAALARGDARRVRRAPAGAPPALAAEIAATAAALARPVAVDVLGRRTLDAFDLASARRAPRAFVVDGLARRAAGASLARRPVLFAILARLAAAWPRAVGWRDLARDVFDSPLADESDFFRARVEIARLRRLLPRGARIVAERNAWRLAPRRGDAVVLLEPVAREAGDELLALLADGAAWSVPALARASGASARTVQRALGDLARAGLAAASGAARARRWVATAPAGIASQMFLVGLARSKRG